MMRCYLGPPDDPKRFRLNVWDSRYRRKGVSTAHDHPWHFKSVIVAGQFGNQRYQMLKGPYEPRGESNPVFDPTHHFMTIKTGEGGGGEGLPIEDCVLVPLVLERYGPGNVYFQRADEVHDTKYHDGSVTLNERTRVGDGEHARVFWPYGTEWVDAEPRRATAFEVEQTMALALKGFS
jgi:hypothetical protein